MVSGSMRSLSLFTKGTFCVRSSAAMTPTLHMSSAGEYVRTPIGISGPR